MEKNIVFTDAQAERLVLMIENGWSAFVDDMADAEDVLACLSAYIENLRHGRIDKNGNLIE